MRLLGGGESERASEGETRDERVRAPTSGGERERENIWKERKKKICADSFLAAGLEH